MTRIYCHGIVVVWKVDLCCSIVATKSAVQSAVGETSYCSPKVNESGRLTEKLVGLQPITFLYQLPRLG